MEDNWRGSETPPLRPLHGNLGLTLVGTPRSLPSTSHVSVGRVLAPVDVQVPRAFDPLEVIKSYHEPEDFS